MKMYLGDGSTASQVLAVCVGEATTSGTAVTSVVSYALKCMYIESWDTTIPSSIGTYNRNSNLGIVPQVAYMELETQQRKAPYGIGDRIVINTSIVSSATYEFHLQNTKKHY